ncbi:hypothetical protein BMF35_a0684 [Aurantiacibacter gangjinensis]|nr:hypothetical protein BMF35_a0684 [Aurantiacibacter gangjinensis]
MWRHKPRERLADKLSIELPPAANRNREPGCAQLGRIIDRL